MKLKEVIIQNFRGYQGEHRVPISQLTTFIGKNDAGKSTILDALAIFFEHPLGKIDISDFCVFAEKNEELRIGCVFEDLPQKLTIDTTAPTTLKDEYLLNSNGDLEVHKIFRHSNGCKKPTIVAFANHPTADNAALLLIKKNADLKKIGKSVGISETTDKRTNSELRHAIWSMVSDLQFRSMDIELNKEDAKTIWSEIQNYLPEYALFRADRPSTDEDSEVQDPLKIAIKQAINEVADELDLIRDKVKEKTLEVAKRTLEKLADFDSSLASELLPNFKTDQKWDTLFKLSLTGENEIPLNKRGSGVRRLVLFSFFRAEAERLLSESNKSNIIYAIEEPETAQHPDNQEKIVQSLIDIADNGHQVLITTHVPALASLMPTDSLRYVDKSSENHQIKHGSSDVYNEIADALGVLPSPIKNNGIKVAVLVEGYTDVDALISMAKVLAEAGEIESLPLDTGQIFWVLGGGSTLQHWVERNYISALSVPQVVIFDSDKENENFPVKEKTLQLQRDINAWDDRTAFITQKRMIENYIDIDSFNELTDRKLTIPDSLCPNYSNLPKELYNILCSAIKNNDLHFHADDHEGKPIPATKRNAKRIFTSYVLRKIPSDKLKARCKYIDQDGNEKFEVIDWLNEINRHCKS